MCKPSTFVSGMMMPLTLVCGNLFVDVSLIRLWDKCIFGERKSNKQATGLPADKESVLIYSRLSICTWSQLDQLNGQASPMGHNRDMHPVWASFKGAIPGALRTWNCAGLFLQKAQIFPICECALLFHKERE